MRNISCNYNSIRFAGIRCLKFIKYFLIFTCANFANNQQGGGSSFIYLRVGIDYPDAENFLFLLYGPIGRSKHQGDNYANYDNPAYDALYRQLQALDDGPAKQAVIDQMVTIAQHDSPWCFGYFPFGGLAFQQWVTNGKPSILIRDMAKYYRIDPQLRAARQHEWNAPVVWPMGVLALGLAAVVWVGRRSFKARETATARRLPVPPTAAPRI